jgi:hypothetical protein
MAGNRDPYLTIPVSVSLDVGVGRGFAEDFLPAGSLSMCLHHPAGAI